MNKTHLKYMIQKNLPATNCLRYKAAPINNLIMNVVKEQTKTNSGACRFVHFSDPIF